MYAPAQTEPSAPPIRMAGFNLFSVSDKEPEIVEVWPENWPAFNLFCTVQTQWHVGAAGATGLNYLVLLALMARMKLSDADHDELFDDVQTLERAALAAMQTKD